MVLSPDEILREVATDGGDAIRFADRLYTERPMSDPFAIAFSRWRIERFAVSREIITAEQLFLEAHALASLDQSVTRRETNGGGARAGTRSSGLARGIHRVAAPMGAC